eukprot:973441-Pelagomonas_calceolata.AAC.2
MHRANGSVHGTHQGVKRSSSGPGAWASGSGASDSSDTDDGNDTGRGVADGLRSSRCVCVCFKGGGIGSKCAAGVKKGLVLFPVGVSRPNLLAASFLAATCQTCPFGWGAVHNAASVSIFGVDTYLPVFVLLSPWGMHSFWGQSAAMGTSCQHEEDATSALRARCGWIKGQRQDRHEVGEHEVAIEWGGLFTR